MKGRVGRYQLQERIGQGSMAYVFKAFDPKIQRSLAIKVLKKERIQDAEYRKLFLREAKTAGKLSHPGIVTVFDAGEIQKYPYMVMELLDGNTLEDAVERKRLPVTTIIQIGIQLAEALDYAHSKGVVHRDIKPDNIFWEKGSNKTKITDFGIAHLEDTYDADTTSDTDVDTEELSLVAGTPEYMSPEQALGQPLDGRSDLYSLGVILYRMLWEELPFNAPVLGELIQKIVNDTPSFDAKRRIPNELRQIVTKLLRKQQDQRYQTGRELAADLREVLGHLEKAKDDEEIRIIPLRVKWAMGMAMSIMLTMTLALVVVYYKQTQSMTGLVFDYGASLVKMLSFETAEALLINDHIAIQTLTEEMEHNEELLYLTIVDRANTVLGSTNPGIVGTSYKRQGLTDITKSRDDVLIREGADSNGEPVYDFETLVLYQENVVGLIRIGLSRSNLSKAAKTTLLMMVILMIVTIGSVIITTYVMANRLSQPIDTMKRALNKVVLGEYDKRIAIDRNDEFAQLYIAFNQMAKTLEEMHDEDNNE